MKVLGICGSPRKKGNTDILVDRALQGARSAGAVTKKIFLNDLKFLPCQECRIVKKDGTCRVMDKFQVIHGKVAWADAVIVASPVFFGSVSAQTKMMIDRFQCLWLAKNVFKTVKDLPQKKKGAFISVQSTRRKDFFRNARSVIRNFFAVIGVKYEGELYCDGIESKGDVLESPELLKKAFVLGKKIAGGTSYKPKRKLVE